MKHKNALLCGKIFQIPPPQKELANETNGICRKDYSIERILFIRIMI